MRSIICASYQTRAIRDAATLGIWVGYVPWLWVRIFYKHSMYLRLVDHTVANWTLGGMFRQFRYGQAVLNALCVKNMP